MLPAPLAEVERVRLPAEHVAVEGARFIHVVGVQPAEVPCARLVDELGAPVATGLPDVDRRALPVGEHRHAAGLHDVEGLDQDAAAGVPGLGGRVVCALDPDVRAPERLRRRALRLRADRGDVLAANGRDEVVAGRVGRHAVLEVPPEQAPVELDRSLRVGLGGVDPARHTLRISVSLQHRCSFAFVVGGRLRKV